MCGLVQFSPMQAATTDSFALPMFRPYTSLTVLLLPVLEILLSTSALAAEKNLAVGAEVTADSSLRQSSPPEKAVDGRIGDAYRWVSGDGQGPHWLEIHLRERVRVASAHVHTGYGDSSLVRNFSLQQWSDGQWKDIPGAFVKNNQETSVILKFKKTVKTDRLRLISDDQGPMRVKEILLWSKSGESGPPLFAGIADEAPFVDPTRHYIFVNQSGYNLDWPKRFTAPLSPDGSEFVVLSSDADEELFRGHIHGGVGDFTEFRPRDKELEYVIRVTGGELSPSESDPFRVAPRLIEEVCMNQAVRFMVDARSVVGTHNSAYGGTPWRDGTYYTFELPSLVLLYLSNPDYFDRLPIEIDYARERKRVLDPKFKLVKAAHDRDVLNSARRYYREVEPPIGDQVPDIIQCVHWTIGMYLVDPKTHDPSGDPLGNRIHAQTVEQFAFFLYAYPEFAQYIPHSLYEQALEFATSHWKEVGLLEVITEIGSFKGRHCPGHSIMPNLMMYVVAKREGRPDAGVFLQAAINQTEWVITNLDWHDPIVTKGQRMSEHKLLTGLVMLIKEFPDVAPPSLKPKLDRWAEMMISRSANMWDFRRYSDELWTIPRFTGQKPSTSGAAGWNEPGNVAAFPGICFAVAGVLDDTEKAARLREIGVAHLDHLFGRNPIGAHSSAKGPEYFAGVERGWPKHFPENVCARLENVRGTINSSAGHEHFPLNPRGKFRHPEGWTAFNAAFNVGLAYIGWDGDGPKSLVPTETGGRHD